MGVAAFDSGYAPFPDTILGRLGPGPDRWPEQTYPLREG